jgi:hypothetical protein
MWIDRSAIWRGIGAMVLGMVVCTAPPILGALGAVLLFGADLRSFVGGAVFGAAMIWWITYALDVVRRRTNHGETK